MQGLSKGVELVKFGKDPDDGNWFVAQLAVHGTLCVAFSFGASNIVGWDEQQLGEYLERQANELISMYGDARTAKHNQEAA